MSKKTAGSFSLLDDTSDSADSREESDDNIENKAKQCLEPLVDWTPKHRALEHRLLWFLGVFTVVVMLVSILIIQYEDSLQPKANNSSQQHSQTMEPTSDEETKHSFTPPPLLQPIRQPPTSTPSIFSSPNSTAESSETVSYDYSSSPPVFLNSTTPSPIPASNTPAQSTINSSLSISTNLFNSSSISELYSLPSSSPSDVLTSRPSQSPTQFPSSATEFPTISTSMPSLIPSPLPSIMTEPPTQIQISESPSVLPTTQILYSPGNLTTFKHGIMLSEGLDARLIASTGDRVLLADGTRSLAKFHGQPDGGDTFPDTRPNNPGGWIYVSNSEMSTVGAGGVGAITFDRNGSILEYKMILEGTSMNCGGGRTPWDTWVSCEEIEFDGLIYQVDPTGARQAQRMTLGSSGGRWESFAFDVRDRAIPRFFATEDHNKGTVRRFTPNNPEWNQPWDMLHADGVVDFLMIFPNATNDGGKFAWTNDKRAAKNNARSYYPQTEGIDVDDDGTMYFVCKNIRQLFVLNLDEGTYLNRTTRTGLFDGKPDQVARILSDSNDILYFTEEGGRDPGIHARDSEGRFYSILEGRKFSDETTGLAFSPDSTHLYFSFQNNGKVFDVWRRDGLPFNAKKLDVKYHSSARSRRK